MPITHCSGKRWPRLRRAESQAVNWDRRWIGRSEVKRSSNSSFEPRRLEFSAAAGLRWTRTKQLILDTASNQDSPLMSKRRSLLGIDVWEHAYYLKYQNRRADYLTAIVHVVNWDYVSQRYSELAR